jgi:hypothetical protein
LIEKENVWLKRGGSRQLYTQLPALATLTFPTVLDYCPNSACSSRYPTHRQQTPSTQRGILEVHDLVVRCREAPRYAESKHSAHDSGENRPSTLASQMSCLASPRPLISPIWEYSSGCQCPLLSHSTGGDERLRYVQFQRNDRTAIIRTLRLTSWTRRMTMPWKLVSVG